MKYGEWQKEAEKLDKEQAKKISNAIDVLEGWEPFKQEFKWTGIFLLKHFITAAQEVKRGREAHKGN